MDGRLVIVSVCMALVVVTPGLGHARQNDHPALDAKGSQQNRDYFSQMLFDHIDTLSGGLVLTQSSIAFRALSSHVDRGDPAFKGVAKTADNAIRLIKGILENPSSMIVRDRRIDVLNSRAKESA